MHRQDKDDKRIAIDLLWLRPGKVGGTEPYIRNLLKGFMKLDDAYEFVLLCSLDNADTFADYVKDERFSILKAPIENANIGRRIIWQNLRQNSLLRRNGLRRCFTPVYCRPVFNGGIAYINTIHDIQAYHYPQYHPFYEVWFSKINWIVDKFKSRHIVAISEFVKDDLMNEYRFDPDKIDVIYNPVTLNSKDVTDFATLEDKYGIADGEYYYSVSQLIPHKNFNTLIKVMEKIVKEDIDLPKKLLVSGINGNAADELRAGLASSGLEDNVIFTGYVENDVRNTLYAHCRAFLFPSVFEGFGMTPVEAMFYGKTVITTRCASIPEVTQNKAVYVDDPYDADEWIEKMKAVRTGDGVPAGETDTQSIDMSIYEDRAVAAKYLKLINRVFDIS